MRKLFWGISTLSTVAVVSVAVHFATLPPAPPEVPPVPDKIVTPTVPALTPVSYTHLTLPTSDLV